MTVNPGRYALVYFGVMLLLAGLSVTLVRVAGVRFPPGAASIIPPMIAALFEGQQIGKATRGVPGGAAAWRMAGLLTLVAVAVNLAVIGLFLLQPEARDLLLQVPAGFAASMAAVLALAVLLVNRFFLTIGAKSGARGAKGGGA